MIKLVKVGDAYVNGSHREYIIDSSSDVDNLPGIEECAAGSIAKSTDGVTYVMSPSGDWNVYNVASGSSDVVVTQTITSGTEIGSVNGTKLYAPNTGSNSGDESTNELGCVFVNAVPWSMWDNTDEYNVVVTISNFDRTTGEYYYRTLDGDHSNVIYKGSMPGGGWSRFPKNCYTLTPLIGDFIIEVVKLDSNNKCIAYGYTHYYVGV